jgi:hypothetical protein
MLITINHTLTLQHKKVSALNIRFVLYFNDILYFALTHQLGTRKNTFEKYRLQSMEKNVKWHCFFSTWNLN